MWSFVLGFLSSFALWYLLYHGMKIKLIFSSEISKSKGQLDGFGYRYRVKVINKSRRDLIDLELIAKFRIKGLREKFPENIDEIDIPILANRRVRFSSTKKNNQSEIICFLVNEIDSHKFIEFPDNIKTDISSKKLSLDDLLKIKKDAHLQIYAFAYDSFTGNRKVFNSKEYKLEDIKDGLFESASLNINDNLKIRNA